MHSMQNEKKQEKPQSTMHNNDNAVFFLPLLVPSPSAEINLCVAQERSHVFHSLLVIEMFILIPPNDEYISMKAPFTCCVSLQCDLVNAMDFPFCWHNHRLCMFNRCTRFTLWILNSSDKKKIGAKKRGTKNPLKWENILPGE